MRLAAAFAVIVSHSFEIVGGPPESEPLRVLTNGDSSLGRVAVMTFFVLSGFLLTCSYRSDPSLAAFARKRALRIAPALAAVVLFSIFVIGFAATTLSPRDYFRSEETWRYLANLAFYTGFDSLPGVFADAPIAGVVNGPLWTLKIEVLCYATLAAAGATRLLRSGAVAAMVVLLYVASAFLGAGAHGGALYYLEQYADLARSFFAGSLFALLGSRIALSRNTALLALAGLAVAAPYGLLSEVFPFLGGYLVFWLGFAHLGAVRRAGR
ncbi:MAG: acyltransferase [Parvularculaceae bacterium]|nr:acyltransferase [Parvularculaceae bacterium]